MIQSPSNVVIKTPIKRKRGGDVESDDAETEANGDESVAGIQSNDPVNRRTKDQTRAAMGVDQVEHDDSDKLIDRENSDEDTDILPMKRESGSFA